MWRFIVLTFAFLGWSFYVLSGGADYEPRTQSIQARAKLNDLRPMARPAPAVVVAEAAQPAEAPETVARALTTVDDIAVPTTGRVEVTLASVTVDSTLEPAFEADLQKTEILTQTPDITTGADTAEPAMDIRQVTGTVVNMRDGPSTYFLKLGKLRQGDEVEVLGASGDGWLQIRVTDTGQIGWMADWLVSAAAN